MRNPPISSLFLIHLSTIFVGLNIVLVSSQCLDDQRLLLLQLKNTLNFNSSSASKLVEWNQSSDCHNWLGVKCDMVGHVIALDLSSELISGGINDSSALFSLSSLKSLNLANNSFNYAQIPPSFGNLTNLSSLNLSSSGFAGQIPIELSQLKKLVSLDLSALYFPGTPSLQLQNPNLSTILQNLTRLTELHLDGVNISATGTEWCKAISSALPNLQVLSMSNCHLSGPIDSSLQKLPVLSEIHLGSNNFSAPVPEFLANFSNLTILSLSSCSLSGTFPNKIFQVPTLRVLDLENNGFLYGSLPEFPQNGLLQHLVLGGTHFSGSLPNSIGNLKILSKLVLSSCQFRGPIPNSMANLTQLVHLDLQSNMFTGPLPSFKMSKNLTYMDLSHNNLSGTVPSTHVEGLSKLAFIDLAYNSFNGSIPSSLFSLPSLLQIFLSDNQFDGIIAEPENNSLSPLDTLDISSNNLQGNIPPFMFKFRRLSVLSLSFNNFSGSVQLEMIHNLKNLTKLELSYNNLSIDAGDGNSNSSSFPLLKMLRLASCNLKNFPALINQSGMTSLDLSDNQISGKIPKWVWNIGNGSLYYLNLSHNLLRGMETPFDIRGLGVIDLHSNQLIGEIPKPSEPAIYVDYSNNSFNSIPDDIGNDLTFATYFSVSNNNITGPIPLSLCFAINLQVLDLSNNRFNSTIPQFLIEVSTGTLGVLNLHNNFFTGNIRDAFPEGCTLETLDFNGNLLEGPVPNSVANCKILEVLNLGNNRINDDFPCFLKNSSSLRVLVLRSNKFKGDILCGDPTNNTWPKLQIIDLAVNNFSGNLPTKFSLGWKGMGRNESEPNHLRFHVFQFSQIYYQVTVTVTNKGLEMQLGKILTIYSSIDFSSNRFVGEIPETIGALKSLYVLNLSRNALTGQVPSSLGNLTNLESLDLSQNKLSGSIPWRLVKLTFLSFLNLSYNHLVGKIPIGAQFQTFSETSFQGNPRLCGPPLNNSCPNSDSAVPSDSFANYSKTDSFDWQFIYTGVGFGIGAGFVAGPLMFWKQGSNWCDERIEEFVGLMLTIFGIILGCCKKEKCEYEGNIKEPLDETWDSDEDEDEEVLKEAALKEGYCVFCTKLDIHAKKAIHNPKCSCHESSPISSFSSSSSSSCS